MLLFVFVFLNLVWFLKVKIENQKCSDCWVVIFSQIYLHHHWTNWEFLTSIKCKYWDSRAFLVKVSIISLGGPHPALLQALTSIKYWVSGRRFSSLAEYSWLVTCTLCAAASLSWTAQYRICKHTSWVIFFHDSDASVAKNSFQVVLTLDVGWASYSQMLLNVTYVSISLRKWQGTQCISD